MTKQEIIDAIPKEWEYVENGEFVHIRKYREVIYGTGINKKIEDSYYWNARVKDLECSYFGDEVKITFEDGEKDITYYFTECYKVQIEHAMEYPKEKAVRELEIAQILYFMQDVEVEETKIEGKSYLIFKLNLYPLKLLIMCKNFNIL